MKRVLFLLLCTISLTFTSCISIYKDSSLSKYGEFYDYRLHDEYLDIFPEVLKESWNVEEYTFFFSETILSDDPYIYLNITFSEEEYANEIARICETQNEYVGKPIEDTKHFYHKAYVKSYGGLVTVYALSIPEEYRIVYVYLGRVYKSLISFPQEYQPKQYEMYGPPDADEYYAFPEE